MDLNAKTEKEILQAEVDRLRRINTRLEEELTKKPKFGKIPHCIDCGNVELVYHPESSRLFYCPRCKVVFSLQVWSAESYRHKFWLCTDCDLPAVVDGLCYTHFEATFGSEQP